MVPSRRGRFAGALGLVTAIMLPLFAPSSVQAATYYWDTNGATAGSGAATGTWGTSVFWSTDATGSIAPTITSPTTSDNLFISAGTNGTTGTITLTASSTQAANSITLDDNVAITITGGTAISLGSTTGAGVFVATGDNAANAIASPITLGAASTFSNLGTGTLTLSGALGLGTNSLSLTGTGPTTLSGVISGTTATGTTVLTLTGAGVKTLSNAGNTFTGDIAINGSTLSYTGTTTTTASQLGRGSGTAYKQILITNGGTFQVASADFNVNTPTATNTAAGVVFNIGTSGGTFDVAATRTFTIDDGSGSGTALTNSQLQGSGTLTKTGAGILSLGNAAASNAVFTGQILVNAGVLKLGAMTAAGVGLGATSANTVIASGAGFDINNNASTVAEPVTINGAGVGGTGNVIFSSNAAGGSFAGPITLATPSTIGSTTAGTLTLASTFTLGANTLTVRNNGTGRVFTDGVISGTGSVVVNNTAAGDYVPRSSHTYSGDTTLTAGFVAVDADSLGTPGSPTSGPFGTGVLKLEGAQLRSSTGTSRTIGNSVSLNADTSFYTAAPEKTLVFSGPITMTGGNRTLTSGVGTTVANTTVLFNGPIGDGGSNLGLIKAGLGNVTLAAVNTYTGGTTVNAGTLQLSGSIPANTALTVAGGAGFSLANGAANPLLSVSSLNLGAGTGTTNIGLDLGTSSDSIATSGAATVANSVGFNINAVSGFGAGTYPLLSAASGLTSGGATYAVTSAPGGFTYTLSTTDSLVQLTSTAASGTGNLYWRGNAGTTSWSVFNGLNTNWYTDSAGLTNAGYNPAPGNTVIFSTTNAVGPAVASKLDNPFFINDLQFTSNPAGVTSVAIAPGLTPSLSLGSLTISPSSAAAGLLLPANAGAVTISAPIVLGAAQTWSLDATGSTLATSGGITGTGNLSLVATAGAPTLTITGANSYTGATAIGAGVNLAQGAANGLPSASAITVDGTLSTGAFAGSVGSLAGGVGTVRNGSATNVTLTVGNDGLNGSFGGIVQNGSTGTLAITKVGVGTQTLSGANAYTGATIVNGGILRLSGSNGATAVTVNTGGTLQTGSATALTVANALTLAGTGTLDLFGNSVTVAGFANAATNTITNTGAGTGTDTLTINTAAQTVAALVTDGPTRKTQLVVNNGLTNTQIVTNTANTFSGGVILAHNAGGTRLSPGTITGTPWGSGPIIVGQAPTDKAGIYFANANQTLTNPIIMNTALGNDRVGIRVDVAGTVLSGVLTANLAPLTFTSNTAVGAVSLTNQITGPSGLVLDVVSLSSASTAFLVTLNNATANLNNYQGDTVINYNATNGKSTTLALARADQLPNGVGKGNVVINSNGTGIGLLNLGGFSDTINGLSGNGTIDGVTGTPTLTVGDGDATSTFSGIIKNTAGSLTLQKVGTGTLTLTGVSAFSGPVVVNGGLVSFPTAPFSNGPLGASLTVQLNGGGISYSSIGLNDLNRPVEILTGNGTIDVSSSTGILSISNLTSTGGNLIKTGPGAAMINSTLTLNGGAAAALVNDGTLVTSFGTNGISALTVGATGNMKFVNFNTEALTVPNMTLASGARLGFELSGVANDSITVTNAPTVAGTVTLDFVTVSPPVAGTYNLISAPAGGLNAATFVLGSAPAGFNYSITRTNTLVSLTLTAYTPIYWNSLANSSWATLNAGANYNWTSDGAGATGSLATPGAADTVIFSSANATGPILTTALNGVFTVDSLQFTSTPAGVTAVTINSGAGGTLNVNPVSTSGGIRVFANGGDVTIAAPLTVMAAQTWDVEASGASLAVTGNAALNAAVNKSGGGALTLSGTNTGSGTLTLSAGTLNLNSNAALGSATLRIGAGTALDNSSAGLVTLANNAQVWGGDFTYLGNTQSLVTGTGAVTLDVNLAVNVQSNTFSVGGSIGDGGNNRSLTKDGSGTLVLGGANTFGGGVKLNSGTLAFGNPNSLGSGTLTINGGILDNFQGSPLTLSSNIQAWNSSFTFAGTNSLDLGASAIVMSTTPTITVSANTLTAGNITGGLNGIIKDGAGTLTLTGANSYLGNTVVNSGVLNISGSLTSTGNTVVNASVLNVTGTMTGNNTTTALSYGNVAGNSVVNVSNNINAFVFTGANVAGSTAVMNQTAGTVTIVPRNGADLQYLSNNGGYGMLNITGGTFNTGRFDGTGATNNNASTAVIYVGGTGTLNQNVGDWFLPIRNSGLMEMTIAPGGNFVRSPAVTAQFSITGLSVSTGNNSYGILNVAGGNVDTGTRGLHFGQGTFASGTPISTGFVNLTGGTLTLGLNIGVGNAVGTTNAYFNFAGGTLKSSAALTAVIPANTANYLFTSTVFGPVANNTNANSAFNAKIGAASNFAGGLTVDTNGFATTFTTALLGATGFGVTQANIGDLTLLGGNSGYIGAPMVRFSAPAAAGATPAAGYALIDSGKVIGIVITSPGVYASGETPTVTLTGGGGSIADFITTPLLTPNTSGGLTKVSAGTLVLGEANTYTGPTTIDGGTLQLGAALTAGSLATTSTIINNGVFAINQTDAVVQGTDFTATAIAGTGSFVQAGTGTTTFITDNTYDGSTTISAGVLTLGNGGTTGSVGKGPIANATGLIFNRTNDYPMSATNLLTGAGAITITGGSITAAVDNQFVSTGALNFLTAVPTTNVQTNTVKLDLSPGASSFGALTVRTNSTTANSILLGNNKTLALGGITLGVDVATAVGATQTKLNITGNGSLAVTGNVQVGVSQTTVNAANNSTGTLDLSGLTGTAGFSANVTNFNIGQGNTSAGVVTLTNVSNTITATTVNVGNSNGNNGVGTCLLTLGTGTNVIQADTINIGISKIGGTVGWAGAGSGSLSITNKAGTGAANITVGSNGGTATGAVFTSLLNLTGHPSTVSAGTLAIGIGNNTAAGSVTGNVNFDTGTFTATTVNIGSKAGTAGTGTATGNLNLSGGAFTVNTGGSMVLGTNTAATGTAVGNLNITGTASFTSNVDITKGGGTNTTANITLDGVGAVMDLVDHKIGSNAQNIIFNLKQGTLKNLNEFNGGSTLVKASAGTVALTTANAFTGQLFVSEGVVQVKHGSALGAPVADTIVSSGAALELSGNIMVAGESLSIDGPGIANGGALRNTTGVNIFAGPVTVSSATRINSDAGTLVLDVGTGSAIVSVNQDLTLGGAGNIVIGDAVTLGTGSLIKDGAGTAELAAANNYSGATTVNAGTLKLDAKSLDDLAAVTIAGGAFMELNFAGVDIVGSLTINGVALPNGVYSAATHPAALTGTGKLQVGTSSAYATWAAAKGLDGSPGKENGTSDDPDKDGNTNLAEFAFDGDPLDPKNNSKVFVFTADSDADVDADKELILTIAVRKTAPAFAGSPSPSSDSTTDGILYAIEGGTALSPFGIASVPVTPITTGLPVYGGADDYEYRSFSLTGSNGLPSRGFFRARATTP